MPNIIELHFVEGENSGVRIKVAADQELVIGRSEKCDVCLSEKKISRRHCRIFQQDGKFTLEDMGSTNGTYVNDQKVSAQVSLQAGDRIRVGTSLIETQIKEGEAALAQKIEVAKAEAAEIAVPLQIEESAPAEPPAAAPTAEREAVKKPLSGSLSEMGLADLLQTLATNRRSGHLLLHGPAQGEVILREGEVVGARAGRVGKEKGFYRLLSWEEADFEFVSYPAAEIAARDEEKIAMGLENLLLEGFRQFDEIARLKSKLPGRGVKLRLNPEMPEKLSKLHPRVLDVLQVALRHPKIQDVLDESPLSDLDAYKILAYLLKKKYLLKHE